jgi:uncharacterized membrane protein YphA (DoxX/SURF4 family)
MPMVSSVTLIGMSIGASIGASIVVGIALLVSGGSKIASGGRWPEDARRLGAPKIAIPVLPWIELIVGALLVVQVASPVPALVALGLMLAFTVLIVRRLAAGEHPPCACFGAWSARPLGRWHVARNLALIALCVLALF